MSNSFDVDIAHIRARTVISLVLAVGAMAQAVGSAMLLNAGLNPQGTALLKIMGVDVSTATVGALALCTSALWAYLAYLARPKTSLEQVKADAKAAPAPRHDSTPEIRDFSLSVPPDTARASN